MCKHRIAGVLPLVFPLLFLGLGVQSHSVFADRGPAESDSQRETADQFGGETGAKQEQVRRWINGLASDNYATRLRARNHLQQLGLDAFDQLHAAQNHPDIEVEMTCRFLLSSLMISWVRDTDSAAIKRTLDQYGTQPEAERGSRIVRLAQFDLDQSLDVLVRLTRFETSSRLSELAALQLMGQPIDADPQQRRRMSEKILSGLGGSSRPSVDWLRVYANDVRSGGYSKNDWRQLIAQQREKIDAQSAHPSTRQSILDLVRICASRSANLGDRQEAIDLANDHLDLIQPTSARLIDAATWALDHRLYPVVLRLREQFERMFERRPALIYASAEAYSASGDDEKAESLAESALNHTPMPDEATAKKMSPRKRQDITVSHLGMARHLADRGRFQWAIREYNHVIDAVDVATWESALARLAACRILAEQLRHQQVVELLEPLVDRLDQDDNFGLRLQNRLTESSKHIRSDLEFHRAQILLKSGQMDQARRKLALAYAKSDQNIDILIRMYRTQGDQAWRSEVTRHLAAAIGTHQKQIDLARARLQTGPSGQSSRLAELLNNYAWLVSNTEGDLDKALRYSKESLSFQQDAAKYDTCARCYYSIGDIDNAIKMQEKAIDLMPHSPPLKRQLAEFKQALAAAQR